MTDANRTREMLLEELEASRRRVDELKGQPVAAAEQVVRLGKLPAELEVGCLLDAVRASVVVHDDKDHLVQLHGPTAARFG